MVQAVQQVDLPGVELGATHAVVRAFVGKEQRLADEQQAHGGNVVVQKLFTAEDHAVTVDGYAVRAVVDRPVFRQNLVQMDIVLTEQQLFPAAAGHVLFKLGHQMMVPVVDAVEGKLVALQKTVLVEDAAEAAALAGVCV